MRNAGNPCAKKGVKYNKGGLIIAGIIVRWIFAIPYGTFLDSVKNSYLVSVILSTIHCT